MSKKVFFLKDYDEVYYIFDERRLTHSIDEEDFSSYDESLTGEEIVNILNNQLYIINKLEEELKEYKSDKNTNVEKTVCGHCKHIKENINGFYCPIIDKNVSYSGKTCSSFDWRFKK